MFCVLFALLFGTEYRPCCERMMHRESLTCSDGAHTSRTASPVCMSIGTADESRARATVCLGTAAHSRCLVLCAPCACAPRPPAPIRRNRHARPCHEHAQERCTVPSVAQQVGPVGLALSSRRTSAAVWRRLGSGVACVGGSQGVANPRPAALGQQRGSQSIHQDLSSQVPPGC